MSDSTTSDAIDSTEPETSRQRGPRKDAARNKAALLVATGDLLRDNPDTATMPAIAEQAGLSIATAYRYFPTLDSLHREFLLNVLDGLSSYSATLALTGTDCFEAVLGHWMGIVAQDGKAMTLIRSREGFLERLFRGERHALVIDAAWGRAVREVMALENVDESMYSYCLSLCNAMFNSREILDLQRNSTRSPARLVQDLTKIYRSALAGVASADF